MSSPKLLFTCAILASTAVSHAQTFAFQSDEHIAVASLADARVKPKKLTEGFDPRISPDGTKVAYTQSDDEGNRRIAIAPGSKPVLVLKGGRNPSVAAK